MALAEGMGRDSSLAGHSQAAEVSSVARIVQTPVPLTTCKQRGKQFSSFSFVSPFI